MDTDATPNPPTGLGADPSLLTRARHVLAGVVAVEHLDLEVAGRIQLVATALTATPEPPAPLPPATASRDIPADLTRVAELLSAAAQQATTASEGIQLGQAARELLSIRTDLHADLRADLATGLRAGQDDDGQTVPE